MFKFKLTGGKEKRDKDGNARAACPQFESHTISKAISKATISDPGATGGEEGPVKVQLRHAWTVYTLICFIAAIIISDSSRLLLSPCTGFPARSRGGWGWCEVCSLSSYGDGGFRPFSGGVGRGVPGGGDEAQGFLNIYFFPFSHKHSWITLAVLLLVW